ncbi:MAG: protein translocase SEC61 complex subunit gamma [archaeon]|nr:protein translocase SEC61 complex subunit gamma [archaeon]
MDEKIVKTPNYQNKIEGMFRTLGKGKYSRIINMARTPTDDEYRKTIMITGIGIIILGAVGFFIQWLITYVPKCF